MIQNSPTHSAHAPFHNCADHTNPDTADRTVPASGGPPTFAAEEFPVGQKLQVIALIVEMGSDLLAFGETRSPVEERVSGRESTICGARSGRTAGAMVLEYQVWQ